MAAFDWSSARMVISAAEAATEPTAADPLAGCPAAAVVVSEKAADPTEGPTEISVEMAIGRRPPPILAGSTPPSPAAPGGTARIAVPSAAVVVPDARPEIGPGTGLDAGPGGEVNRAGGLPEPLPFPDSLLNHRVVSSMTVPPGTAVTPFV